MPNKVIAQVHCLAAVAEHYNGIVFTNINGNILSEKSNEDMDDADNVPDNQHTNYMQEDSPNPHEHDEYKGTGIQMMATQAYCRKQEIIIAM